MNDQAMDPQATATARTVPAASLRTPAFEPNGTPRRHDGEGLFLEQLGQRVHALRLRRGLSRRALAQSSTVSERYIAQLEGGKGNVSIVLLRRISGALDAPLAGLLPAEHA